MAVTTHGYPANLHSPMEFLKGEKFCAAVTADLSKSPDGIVSLTDVMQMIPTCKGLLVTDVFLRIDASTTVSTVVSIGDVSDVNGYDNAVDLAVANGTITKSLEATDAYGVGRLYTSNDLTINLKFATSNVSAGTLTLIAEGVVLEQYA